MTTSQRKQKHMLIVGAFLAFILLSTIFLFLKESRADETMPEMPASSEASIPASEAASMPSSEAASIPASEAASMPSSEAASIPASSEASIPAMPASMPTMP